MKLYIILALAISTCVVSNEELKCKPRPGCHFSGCDPTTGPSFIVLDRNEYPLTCQATDIREAIAQNEQSLRYLMNVTLGSFKQTSKLVYEIEELSKSRDAVNDDIALINQNNTQVNKELGIVQERSSRNKQKIESLEQENINTVAEIASLKGRLEVNLNKIDLFETESSKARKDIDSLKVSTDTHQWRMNRIQKKCDEENQEFKKSLSKLTLNNSKLKEDFDKYVKDSEERLQALESQLKELKEINSQKNSMERSVLPTTTVSTTVIPTIPIRNPCDSKPCDAQAICLAIDIIRYRCVCKASFTGNGKTCRKAPSTVSTQIVREAKCTFDQQNDLCGFHNSVDDDFDWTQNRGSTPTIGTGPSGGLVKNGAPGGYIYIEANFRDKGQTAKLKSPRLAPGTYCIWFYLHMYGLGIGSFRVVTEEHNNRGAIATNTVFSRAGNFANYWRQERIPLTTSRTAIYAEVTFIGVVGTSIYGDIAIDEIFIQSRPC